MNFGKSLLVVLFMVFYCFEAEAAVKPPVLSANTAILVEASTGRVIFEKRADEICYPASMTKMMTGILAIEEEKPYERIVISNLAADTDYPEIGFEVGDELTLREATEAMMIISENSAAVAIAENLGKTYGDFINRMNDKAKEIGAVNTHFVNPNGLPDADHYSTARDMMKIARFGWAMPEFRDIVGRITEPIEWANPSGKRVYIDNTNELLEDYPGMAGIKTGWTSDAGGCLAASATRNGLTLIAVVMGCESGKDRFSDMRALMDYGFSMVKGAEGPVKERLGKDVIVKGSRITKITVYPAYDIYYPILSGESKYKYSIKYNLPHSLQAPLKKHQKVGEMIIYYDGKEIGRTDMLTDKPIERGFSLIAFATEVYETLCSKLFC